MELEIIILSKISQAQKDEWLMFHSYAESRLPQNNNNTI
jgi:hypothetical protein